MSIKKAKGYYPTGSTWLPLKVDSSGRLVLSPDSLIPRLYDRTATQLIISNNNTEQTLYSFTITGGDLSTNKLLRVRLFGYWFNSVNDPETLTVKIYLGDTLLYSDVSFAMGASADKYYPLDFEVLLANQNANNVQVLGGRLLWGGEYATTGHGNFATDEIIANDPIYNTAAVNTSADLLFKITITMTTANANVKTVREYAFAELI